MGRSVLRFGAGGWLSLVLGMIAAGMPSVLATFYRNRMDLLGRRSRLPSVVLQGRCQVPGAVGVWTSRKGRVTFRSQLSDNARRRRWDGRGISYDGSSKYISIGALPNESWCFENKGASRRRKGVSVPRSLQPPEGHICRFSLVREGRPERPFWVRTIWSIRILLSKSTKEYEV